MTDYQMDFNLNLTHEQALVLCRVLLPAYAAKEGNQDGVYYLGEIANSIPGQRALSDTQMKFLVSLVNGAERSYRSVQRLSGTKEEDMFPAKYGFLTEPNMRENARCCVFSYATNKYKMLEAQKPESSNSISVAELREIERKGMSELKAYIDAVAAIVLSTSTTEEVVVTQGQFDHVKCSLQGKDAFSEYVRIAEGISERRFYVAPNNKVNGKAEEGVILKHIPIFNGKLNFAALGQSFTEPISVSALEIMQIMFEAVDSIIDFVDNNYEGDDLFDIECDIFAEFSHYVACKAYVAQKDQIPVPPNFVPLVTTIEPPKSIAEALPKAAKQKEKEVQNIKAPKLKGVTVVEQPEEKEVAEATDPNEGLTPQDIILTAVGKDEHLYEAVIQFFEDNDMPLKEAAELTAADIQEYAKLATEDREEVLELETEAPAEPVTEPEAEVETEVEAEADTIELATLEPAKIDLGALFGGLGRK